LAAPDARIKGRRGNNKSDRRGGPLDPGDCWHLLTRSQPDTDLGADYFLERQNSEAYKNRLVRKLQRMGHKVTSEPAKVA
jgi:hypothetical protein